MSCYASEKGDTLAVFNPKDGEWLAQIYNIGKKYVSVEIQKFQHKSHSQSILWLAFAPLKRRNRLPVRKSN